MSFVNTDAPLEDDWLYYVVFQGSKLRHVTSTKVLNPYTLEAIIPGKNYFYLLVHFYHSVVIIPYSV